MKRTFSLVILYLILNGCVSLYEKPEQPVGKSVSNSSNTEVKPPSQKIKIPLYDKPITDTDAYSSVSFIEFIEKNFGKIIHLNMEISADSPFIEYIREATPNNNPSFSVILADKECMKVAKEENISFSSYCGGAVYNLLGEGYDFSRHRTYYILSGYFVVPENRGAYYQGFYGITLEAIPRKEILLKGLE